MTKQPRDKLHGVVPHDGTYLGAKKGKQLKQAEIKAKFDESWELQAKLLKNSSVKLYKDKSAIGVQWQSFVDWDDSILTTPRRLKRGLNALGRGKFPLTADSVNNALKIAQEIDLKIKANAFSWQDYPQWLPTNLRPKTIASDKPKTIAEWIVEFEIDYWKTRDNSGKTKQSFRDKRNWTKGKLRYLKYIKDWGILPNKELFDLACIDYPLSSKRNECCTEIKNFARFCGFIDYDNKQYRITKKQQTVKTKKPKQPLTEDEILEWYVKFPQWIGGTGTRSEWRLWQWWYGMQATYGFRNHEVLNIYNLDCEYTDEHGKKYYPFTDSILNPRGIIYTEGKAVKRAAFLPQPRKWLDDFKLREIPQDYYQFMDSIKNLNGYEQERAKESKRDTYANFLYKHGFTFTAYNLRHAYNVKSHGLGIPVALLAQNLGHNISQNESTYLETMGLQTALDALENWEKRQNNTVENELSVEKQLELLRLENEQLKAVIQQLLESIQK